MQHILALALSLPLQLAMLPLNRRMQLFTPGELRFWAVAAFVLVEVILLSVM